MGVSRLDPGQRDDGLGSALKTLAGRELDALLAALADTRSPHRGIHEARKAIRRLRSLLLFGRKPFGAQGAALDAGWKALAMSLSALRDAHVATETASRVRARVDDPAVHARWAALRRQLARRRDVLLAAERVADPGFAARRTQVQTLGGQLAALPWEDVDTEVVRKALARSLRRVERAHGVAMAARSTLEQRHRWRRRLRRLRMQWSALRPLRKAGADAVQSAARELLDWLKAHTDGFAAVSHAADALGREQDLRLLQQALRQLPRTPAIDSALVELRALRGEAARRRAAQGAGR